MMKQGILSALVMAFLGLAGQSQAASMETIISGVTTPESFDHRSMFVGGYEEANAAGLDFEVTIMWDSQPSGLDPVQSTINQDAGQSSFMAVRGTDTVTGVTSAIVMVGGPATDMFGTVDWFGWTRANDATTGTSTLSLSFHGWFSAEAEFSFSLPASAIVSPLPLAFDAAFALAGQQFSSPGGAFTVTSSDGQSDVGLGLIANSIAFINLDAPVDPPAGTVPLPGALALLLAGLGTLAGVRQARR